MVDAHVIAMRRSKVPTRNVPTDTSTSGLATNALKHVMDQLEEKILQTDQLKNASKHLQHRVDRILR